MAKPKPDPDLVKAALEAVAEGHSFRQIAEAVGSTEGSIRRWAKLAGVRPRSPVTPESVAAVALPAHMLPAPVGKPPPEIDPTDLLGSVRAMLADQSAQMADLRAVGNTRGAQAAAANMAKVALLLKQLESAQLEDATTLKIPRAELDQARAAIRARRDAIAARPIMCAECSRKLSVSQGLGKK
jgi:hypothetical protein